MKADERHAMIGSQSVMSASIQSRQLTLVSSLGDSTRETRRSELGYSS